MTVFHGVMSRRVAGGPSVAEPTLLDRVKKRLGLQSVADDHALVALVEERLDPKIIGRLKEAGLSDDEVYRLIVPRRTLTHRRARHEALSQDESDRAVRVARLTALAEHVFGENERAWRWLRKPKRQLQGRSPLHIMSTEAGARLVEEWLYRIADGMAA